jgi:tungstate transport system substrate-binding protein
MADDTAMASDDPAGVDRRALLVGGAAATLAIAACSTKTDGVPPVEDPAAGPPPAEPGVVRVASVKTAVEGGLMSALITQFEAAAAYKVRLTTGTAVYEQARAGDVDLVVSHYGHRDAEQFVLDGAGEWPRTVFSNQMALVGPPADPAKVRGLDDLAEAFARIAQTRSPYVVNDIDGVRYLTEILWNATGKPDRTGWVHDLEAAKDAAMVRASELGAYVLWGLTPFLRAGAARQLALEPLVLGDPMLQRMMVSVVVKSAPGRAVNTAGAFAFQTFLLAPATQAVIRSVTYPGRDSVHWVPAGRHNRTGFLPKQT